VLICRNAEGYVVNETLGTSGVDTVVFSDVDCRITGGDRSTVPHLFWHQRPTLIGISQLELYRNQWVSVDPAGLCTRCNCATLRCGGKCTLRTVRCCITVATGIFRCQSCQHPPYSAASGPQNPGSVPEHQYTNKRRYWYSLTNFTWLMTG